MNLVEITQRIDALCAQRDKEIEAHKRSIVSLDNDLKRLREERQIVTDGLDLETVRVAEEVIHVRGEYKDSEQRDSVVKDAVSDIANGCSKLGEGFFGVKNYSGFGDQRCDCSYGMGPRHGSIVFSVGLADRKQALTDEQTEAAIYYLLNLRKVQEAKEAAA